MSQVHALYWEFLPRKCFANGIRSTDLRVMTGKTHFASPIKRGCKLKNGKAKQGKWRNYRGSGKVGAREMLLEFTMPYFTCTLDTDPSNSVYPSGTLKGAEPEWNLTPNPVL